jgi:polyhydroxyalkanoate synthesis regulator phasin
MNIDWPLALIMMVTIGACAGVVSEFVKSRARSAQDEAGAKYAEQYRIISADYDTLLKESRDSQAAIQSELVELHKKVDSIEKLLREVG